MRKLIYTLVILSMANLSFAQWYVVNLGTTNTFTGITLSTDQIYFATAYNPTTLAGIFYKSTNSGANWFQLSFPANFKYPTTCQMSGNGLNGIVAGSMLLATSNGGVNWSSMYSSPDTVLFFGADVRGDAVPALWAVGNKWFGGYSLGAPVVIRCSNILTANPQYIRLSLPSNMSSYQLNCVWAIDSNTCCIGVNAGTIFSGVLKTTNKGVTWSEVWTGVSQILSINIDNNGYGFAVGGGGMWNSNRDTSHYCAIYVTFDYGSSWMSAYQNSNTIGPLIGLYYGSGGPYTVGMGGKILKGGTNWTLQNSGVTSTLNAVSALSSNNNLAYAVGENGIMLRTSNGGLSAQNISSEIPSKYSLSQNYPNPFNPITKIRFDIQKSEFRSQNSEVRIQKSL